MSSLIEQFTAATPEAPFPASQYPALADEVRARILEVVGKNGGHLASNLGVVELTIALLATFNPRRDRVIWDVSHQCYAWKLLTGRAAEFPTLRRHGGISGFLKRHESEADAFGAGHAGTAISAALGMAVARDRLGGHEHVVAVVGDASIANGISLEALNNIATTTSRLIVILNDNEMSISENVGAFSRYFANLLASHHYNRVKKRVERFAQDRLHLSGLRGFYHRLEKGIKGLFVRNGVFEGLGLRYVGPIDGHDFKSLMNALASVRDDDRPIVLHLVTTKGRGYAPAERTPELWHGVGPFDVATGALPPPRPGYSFAFGQILSRLADQDARVVGITAAMEDGTGLGPFAAAHPDRFFDVGICEEHAVTFAAGLAASGMRPFVAVYSTFAQRAVDSVFHDVCLQNLPVTLCLDRAGIVGADGPTHHGVFDIPMLRDLPNLAILQPRDEAMLARMMASALAHGAPCAIRYPRGGAGAAENLPASPAPIEIGKAEVLREPFAGAEPALWIWALGDMLPTAMEVADALEAKGVFAGVVDPRSIKPLDLGLLLDQARAGARFATLENGALAGGFGSAVLEALSDAGLPNAVRRFGWPDRYIPHGSDVELRRDFGLDAESIVRVLLAPPAGK